MKILRFIYICPYCGNIIFKREKDFNEVGKIKCQKCNKILWFNELTLKRIPVNNLFTKLSTTKK